MSDSISVPESVPYEGFDEDADSQIRQLAQTLTHQSASQAQESVRDDLLRVITSMSSVPGIEPYSGGVDPRLDPENGSFDSRFWVKNLRKLVQSNEEFYQPTSLGVVYKDLRVQGISSDADFQPTVLNAGWKVLRDRYYDWFRANDRSRYFDILKPMDGYIEPGSLTVVLGRPGAGCSTLLKTIACQTYGFQVDPESTLSFDGLTPKDIERHCRGEIVYSAETECHFPHLTVGQTLNFAAKLRTPENRPAGVSRDMYADHMAKVYMATYGLSHTYNTKVGDDFVRGVSGGERKRVSIAEVSLCGANIQCWDNATRGLDAATALEFIKSLKTSAALLDITPVIAIYQCSQDAYDLFDNVILLYEGRQIFMGRATEARRYFERMGYECPQRQTTADFLTSITSPEERRAKKGWETRVPKTPDEFESFWKKSPECAHLRDRIDAHLAETATLNTRELYHAAHRVKQAKHTRPASSYRVSYWMQVKSTYLRNYWRIKGDPSIVVGSATGNVIMGLIMSSLFYNIQPVTATFYYRTAAMFMAVLFNAFSSLNEIITLYEARPIVEKHRKFALYHPSADAVGSLLIELIPKLLTCVLFNLIFYFMVNFRRDPGHFFYYLLINFVSTLAMSHIFRVVGSSFKTLSASMTPAALLLLVIVCYTGFALPTPFMHGWSRWINYIDPVAYSFESLIANEFTARDFECSSFLPPYESAPLANKVCNAVSGQPGQSTINGDSYIWISFKYLNSHRWRNFGIIVAYAIFFLALYLLLVEYNRGAMQKGEVIVFQRSTLRKIRRQQNKNDIEAGHDKFVVADDTGSASSSTGFESSAIFHWRDVCYEVQIKKETRRILDHVDGWVKPGTLTALMGASGAGKTTLLDVLANRVTMGVVSGNIFVDGKPRDTSFQRSTGYVQQQDLHLQTSTVREALRFSAYLRQPSSVSKAEKDAYVESVIDILDMRPYADAIVGVTGEGLNVEQRKRLTIGVELAAKPKLLLFLDEPTSGLDSQTAWSICQLIRKLANRGQAILCTIHQPSAILMQEFDRLLFLSMGGRTVYFGELGANCQTLIDYFESHGAHSCPPQANPAEWMLEVIGAAPGSHAEQDYHEVWLESTEREKVRDELEAMEKNEKNEKDDTQVVHSQFAASWWTQYKWVTFRVFQQYWRTPSYIWSKILLTVFCSLFNGFSFYNAGTSLQGLQNQMLSIFMYTTVLGTVINQMLDQYVSQRDLYEVRERPSSTFSWKLFLAAQVSVEVPWAVLMGTLGFFCWYYPVGMQHNAAAAGQLAERGVLTWFLIVSFYMYAITFGQACVAGLEKVDGAAQIAMLLFTLATAFSGVLYYPTGFWIFMYYLSPFTYWIAGILSSGVGSSDIHCVPSEFRTFPPPEGVTCQDYLQPYIDSAGGYLADPGATHNCSFCPMSSTNAYLASIHVNDAKRWRNWGIFFCYIVFNILAFFFFYWLARVPKKKDRVQDESRLKSVSQKPLSQLPQEV